MKALRDGTTVGLDRYRILRLEHARGVSVKCQTGMLWLTQEGVPDDAFLAPGEQLEIQTRRLVLVEALRDSTFRLSGRTSFIRPEARAARPRPASPACATWCGRSAPSTPSDP